MKKQLTAWVAVGLAAPCLFMLIVSMIYCFPVKMSKTILLVLGSISTLVALVLLRRRGLVFLIGPAVIGLSVFAAALFIPEKKRLYLAFYNSIYSTMTSVEVQQQFHLYFPDHQTNGWPTMVVWPEGMQFVLDPRSGAYNAELIEVSLTNDRVSDKKYLPD